MKQIAPLFVDDIQLRRIVQPEMPVREFFARIEQLESDGFPKLDPRFGGRYLPAVYAFFDRQYGLGEARIKTPGGVERPDAWQKKHRA